MNRLTLNYFSLAVLAFQGFGGLSVAQVKDEVFAQYRSEVDKAVERGLEFLASRQQPEGHFNDQYGKSSGIAGLVGMAFLSKGHLPGSGVFGETLNRSVDYVLSSQQKNGLLDRNDSGHGPMYSHNIGTLFLSECSGMVDPARQDRIEDALARATELLLRAQAVPKDANNAGGWRYKPESNDSDLSCSGWALMALRSAKLNGAPVPDEAIAKAVKYVFGKHDARMGRFGYTNTESHAETLTGCGLLCLELCGYHGHESTYKAGEFILNTHAKLPQSSHELYGNYYNAQGMFQLGGKYWRKYAEWMYGHYLPRQKADGSWQGRDGGMTYGTAMVILSLAVPYRQLPIYQRDETVDEEP
ncbi:MAG: Prenyltransferase and squalene oxidase repeat-containing protein [Verrucomicrobia bacterium]|nr:MAG: Prenyltransferase and squalene oxidase repeat-containing protein [Verrucomicrobiota bacterium]